MLVPSVKQVNEHSDIRVAMETKREKRRIAALRFSVERGPALSEDAPVEASGLAVVIEAATEDPETEALDLSAAVRARLAELGLTEAQAADLTAEFAADRVDRNLGFVEDKLASGGDVKNLAAYTVAAVRGDYERSGRAANRKRTAAQRKAAEKAAAAQQGLFPSPAVVAVRSLEDEEDAENRQIDATIAAFSDAERAALDAEAVDLLRESGSGWWREIEGAVAAGETDGLGIAVRSVLQVARRDVTRAREKR